MINIGLETDTNKHTIDRSGFSGSCFLERHLTLKSKLRRGPIFDFRLGTFA